MVIRLLCLQYMKSHRQMTLMKGLSYKCIAKDIYLSMSLAIKLKHLKNVFVMTSLSLLWTKVCLQLIIGFLSHLSGMKFIDSFKIQTHF